MPTLLISILSLFSVFAMAAQDLTEFNHLDPQHLVPDRPLKQALTYLQDHRAEFPNQDYMVVIDYTQHSSKERMFIIDLKTGKVEKYLTSHGRGSDPKGTGYAKIFSNENNSLATSLGAFRSAETYIGEHGKALRLDGLSETNSKARERDVVIHPAPYVSEKHEWAGRSWGCPALDPEVFKMVIDKIKNGALIYAWADR